MYNAKNENVLIGLFLAHKRFRQYKTTAYIYILINMNTVPKLFSS